MGEGRIIASLAGVGPAHPETYHNNFQDPERFLAAGGRRGRQLQVLVDGTYYVNWLFATVEIIPKTVVEVGHVGVVVWYVQDILAQLRTRQIAQDQVETYERQEMAAVKERELREAEARSREQQRLTESGIAITVQSNQGKASYQLALQEAAKVRALAEAEADRIRELAEAEAEKAARVGVGEAIAIEEQVRAYGGPRFQLTQQVMSRFAEAIEAARVDVVPKIVIGGGHGHAANGSDNGNGGSGPAGTGSLIDALLAMLLSERFEADVSAPTNGPRDPRAESLRGEIRGRIDAKTDPVPKAA